VQTFGSTTALTTQASIVVSTLSAGSYAIQASFSGDNVYALSTSSTLNQVLTPPSVGVTHRNQRGGQRWQIPFTHTRFRNPASSITIRACGFTKPDAGSVVGSAQPHIRLTLLSAFFPESKVFPESRAETLGAVPKLVVNLSLDPRQPCPRMFERANSNKSQWPPIKRLIFLPNGHESPKNRSSVSSKRLVLQSRD
jgi:hypothetical protein